MRSVEANVADVRDRVATACRRVGRPPEEVTIVAVAKGVTPDRIREAVDAGVTDIGENRAQELRDKVRVLGEEAVRWHYVGRVQTNKVRYLDPVHMVHSVGRGKEARALEKRGAKDGRSWDVLLEVNVAGETTKQGVPPESLGALLEEMRAYPRVRVRGLMIMAPQAENPEDVRWVFAEGRRLCDRYREALDGPEELSMGMTDDLEVAVEEGATIVRVGRAIFREE